MELEIAVHLSRQKPTTGLIERAHLELKCPFAGFALIHINGSALDFSANFLRKAPIVFRRAPNVKLAAGNRGEPDSPRISL